MFSNPTDLGGVEPGFSNFISNNQIVLILNFNPQSIKPRQQSIDFNCFVAKTNTQLWLPKTCLVLNGLASKLTRGIVSFDAHLGAFLLEHHRQALGGLVQRLECGPVAIAYAQVLEFAQVVGGGDDKLAVGVDHQTANATLLRLLQRDERRLELGPLQALRIGLQLARPIVRVIGSPPDAIAFVVGNVQSRNQQNLVQKALPARASGKPFMTQTPSMNTSDML